MKRTALAVLSLAILLVVSVPAHAASSLDDTVAALKQSAVYVAPGTEGTDSDTAGVLADQLSDGDNLLVVMLPASAAGDVGDLTAFAHKIDDAFAHHKIVALSVGDSVVAYSAILPAGEAADLMHRATDVSTNTSETLVTFIRNVHDWQRRNPDARASKKPVTSSGSSSLPFFVIGAAVFIFFVGLGLFFANKHNSTYGNEEDTKFRFTPDQVRDVLEQLQKLRYSVHDRGLQDLLTQICRDTEAYFQRTHGQRDERAKDAKAFQDQLGTMRDVVVKYIDIQDNPRYYDERPKLMENGYAAVEGFSTQVVNTIKRGNRQSLMDFQVDTDILAAQRYSS